MENIDNIISKYSPKMGSFFIQQLSEIQSKIEPLQRKIEPLQKQLDPLLKEQEELLSVLKDLGISLPVEPTITQQLFVPVPTSYNPAWSVIEKAIYLTQSHGYLSLAQVTDLIMEHEPLRSRVDIKNNLSVSFSQDANKEKNGKNRLVRRLNSNNIWEYKAK